MLQLVNSVSRLCRNAIHLSKTGHDISISAGTCTHFLYLNARLLSNKEIIPAAKSHSDEDILLQNIRSSRQVSHVLEAIGKHHSIMNTNHISHAMITLFNLQSSNCTSMESTEVLKTEEFETLCKKLHKHSRAMDVSTLINNLKVLVYFEVPVTSVSVQGILHLIKHQINDLTLQEITFLSFLFSKLGEDPLASAINMALPVVFEAQLDKQVDKSDLRELADLLRYAVYSRVSKTCCAKLIKYLSELPQPIVGREALIVATATFTADYICDEQISLSQKALDGIAFNIKSYKKQELKHLLSKVVSRRSQQRLFYNENFFDSCVNLVIAKNYPFEDAVWILKQLTTAAHTSISLLDYIAKVIEKEPQILERSSLFCIFSITHGFANADYKPPNWDQIKDSIMNSWKFIPEDNVRLPWVNYAMELTELDCLPYELLDHIFSAAFLQEYLQRERNFLDYIQILTLFQSVKALHPDYKGILPAEEIINKAIEVNGTNITEFPLQNALEKAFGGKEYVLTQVYTKLGHFIDHAIIVRKGGFPVAINQTLNSTSPQERLFVDDLKILEDGHVILILALLPGSVSYNARRLRCSVALRIRSLEAAGFAVVAVQTDTWKLLPDHEKIPYLMQEIKLKSLANNEQVAYH